VGMKCSRLGKSSMVFEAGIFRGDKLLISYGDNDSSVKIIETTMEEVMKTFED